MILHTRELREDVRLRDRRRRDVCCRRQELRDRRLGLSGRRAGGHHRTRRIPPLRGDFDAPNRFPVLVDLPRDAGDGIPWVKRENDLEFLLTAHFVHPMVTQFCATDKELLFVWVHWLDLASVFGEVVDVLAKRLHILAGVFQRFRLHLGFDLVSSSRPGSAFEFHGQRDTNISALDALCLLRLISVHCRFCRVGGWLLRVRHFIPTRTIGRSSHLPRAKTRFYQMPSWLSVQPVTGNLTVLQTLREPLGRSHQGRTQSRYW